MEVLPLNVATEMDAAFAELRSIEAELLTVDITEEPHPPVVKTLANNAMVAVRRIGSALGYRRWDSGENMVRMFQLARAMPSDAIGGTELVQCVHDYRSDNYVWEDPEESNNRVSVRVLRLIFRLADADSIEAATPASFSEWENRCQSIGAVHNALFPGEHCIVEFRDKSAATVSRSSPIGPSYAEVIAEQEAVRAKNK